jgi:hypothetical protein
MKSAMTKQAIAHINTAITTMQVAKIVIRVVSIQFISGILPRR